MDNVIQLDQHRRSTPPRYAYLKAYYQNLGTFPPFYEAVRKAAIKSKAPDDTCYLSLDRWVTINQLPEEEQAIIRDLVSLMPGGPDV